MKLNSKCLLFSAGFFLWLAGVNSTQAAAEDVIKQTFEAAPGGQLVVMVDRGSITVGSAAASRCEVRVTRKAKNQKTLDAHDITFGQEGNRISVSAQLQPERTALGDSLQVEYVITVPEEFAVDLKTAGGSVTVTGLHGRVQAKSSGGNLRFEKIQGPLEASTSGGSVSVTGVAGTVDVKSSGGALKLAEITGDVSARTSGGSISGSRLTGKSVVHTSGGSVTVLDINGQVEAATSGGNIQASLAGPPAGECSFRTSGGSVSIELPADISVAVDAKTSAGSVSSDFAVNPPPDPKRKGVLVGKIDRGGPLIVAKTSGGSIRLKKRSDSR